MDFDRSTLPERAQMRPGLLNAQWLGSPILHFGTMYVAARSTPKPGSFRQYPEMSDMIGELKDGNNPFTLPAGWSIPEPRWNFVCNGEVDCLSMWLSVPHYMKMNGWEIPHEVGALLSANLQLGAPFTYERFRSRKLLGSKYLSFLITPTDYRFYVYHPTSENIQRGIMLFTEVFDIIQSISSPLPDIAADIYAAIRLEEVRLSHPRAQEVEKEVRERLRKRLEGVSGRLAFVYNDLPESLDTLELTYDFRAMPRTAVKTV
jgi:hypothetical protein